MTCASRSKPCIFHFLQPDKRQLPVPTICRRRRAFRRRWHPNLQSSKGAGRWPGTTQARQRRLTHGAAPRPRWSVAHRLLFDRPLCTQSVTAGAGPAWVSKDTGFGSPGRPRVLLNDFFNPPATGWQSLGHVVRGGPPARLANPSCPSLRLHRPTLRSMSTPGCPVSAGARKCDVFLPCLHGMRAEPILSIVSSPEGMLCRTSKMNSGRSGMAGWETMAACLFDNAPTWSAWGAAMQKAAGPQRLGA